MNNWQYVRTSAFRACSLLGAPRHLNAVPQRKVFNTPLLTEANRRRNTKTVYQKRRPRCQRGGVPLQGKSLFEAIGFISTQRQQVNSRHLQEIHSLALRASIANACPVSKSALP